MQVSQGGDTRAPLRRRSRDVASPPQPRLRRRTWGCVLAALALATPPVAPALSQSSTIMLEAICLPHETLVERLARDHDEHRAWWGVSRQGVAVAELYRNAETGSWTLLRRQPDGVSCALLGGESGAMSGPLDSERP